MKLFKQAFDSKDQLNTIRTLSFLWESVSCILPLSARSRFPYRRMMHSVFWRGNHLGHRFYEFLVFELFLHALNGAGPHQMYLASIVVHEWSLDGLSRDDLYSVIRLLTIDLLELQIIRFQLRITSMVHNFLQSANLLLFLLLLLFAHYLTLHDINF